MKNLPYFLYMAESEGLTDVVSTRRSKLTAIRNSVRQYPEYIVPFSFVEGLCKKYDIDIYSLTEEERSYIDS